MLYLSTSQSQCSFSPLHVLKDSILWLAVAQIIGRSKALNLLGSCQCTIHVTILFFFLDYVVFIRSRELWLQRLIERQLRNPNLTREHNPK